VSRSRLIGLLVLLALAVLPASASAHAVLVTTIPAADAIEQEVPKRVTLTFNEGISRVGSQVQVIGPDGARYDTGTPAVRGKVVSVAVAPDLPPGTSTVAWTVISSDGHRISSAFAFSVGQQTASDSAAAAAAVTFRTPEGASGLQSLSRALRFLGIILLLGLIAIVTLVWEPTMRRGRREDPTTAEAADRAFHGIALRLAWCVPPLLALTALLSLPLEGWANGIDLPSTLELRQGQVMLAQAALSLLLWPLLVRGLQRRHLPLLSAAAFLVILLALTPGIGGHAGAQDLAWLAILIDGAHVLAAGVWGGGVLVLAATAPPCFRATTPESRGPLIRGIVGRFTRIALLALGLLVVTGAVATLLLTSSLTGLWETTWGRVLLAKVAVVAMTVLAAGRVRRADAGFSRSVQLEALLVVAAIALTGTLTGLAPQAPLSAAAAAPPVVTDSFHLEAEIEARQVQIDITPTRAGAQSEVHLIVTDAVGTPITDIVDASITLSSSGVETLPVQLELIDEAHWSGVVRIPTAGEWRVLARLRIGEFREELVEGSMMVS
jgi:copper transport protein